MLYVPTNTYERRSYSATLYPTSFNLDFLLALAICAQRTTCGLCFTSGPIACVLFFVCLYILGREGRRDYTSGPTGDTATIRKVLSTNRVDLGSFSSRCCTFRRTHTSADPIQLLCIRLALPLTLPLPSRFAPSARLVVCVLPRALWLAGDFSCDCMFWDERGGGTTPVGPQVDTATIRTVLSTNHVDLGSFSSRCCAFRRTHTSMDPIRLLCIRLALPLTLPLPSGFVPSARLVVCVSPRAPWLVAILRVFVYVGTREEEDLHRWVHRCTQQPLE